MLLHQPTSSNDPQRNSTSISATPWYIKKLKIDQVWSNLNISGQGIKIGIIDGGIYSQHEDLIDNYFEEFSIDFSNMKRNTIKDRDIKTGAVPLNTHGTNCAAIIAAKKKSKCNPGIAYNSKVSSIQYYRRSEDVVVSSNILMKSLVHKFDSIDIYSVSSSLGPNDGKSIHQLSNNLKLALEYATRNGRRRRRMKTTSRVVNETSRRRHKLTRRAIENFGNIYLVGSGNGGKNFDNCNYDGLFNSIYTIGVGAVDSEYNILEMSEPCSCLVTVVFSGQFNNSVQNFGQKIKTASFKSDKTTGNTISTCQENFTGTSVVAPMLSGIVALALEANKNLTWREILFLIIFSSDFEPFERDAGNLKEQNVKQKHFGKSKNALGLKHSYYHGFGIINAYKMVTLAKYFNLLGLANPKQDIVQMIGDSNNMKNVTSQIINEKKEKFIHFKGQKEIVLKFESLVQKRLFFVEQITLDIILSTNSSRKVIEIKLLCPESEIESILAAKRPLDNNNNGFGRDNKAIHFSTIRCYGEDPTDYSSVKIIIENDDSEVENIIKFLKVTIYGNSINRLFMEKMKAKIENFEKLEQERTQMNIMLPPVGVFKASNLTKNIKNNQAHIKIMETTRKKSCPSINSVKKSTDRENSSLKIASLTDNKQTQKCMENMGIQETFKIMLFYCLPTALVVFLLLVFVAYALKKYGYIDFSWPKDNSYRVASQSRQNDDSFAGEAT